KEQRRGEQSPPAPPSLPPTLDGLNNVSDLISKFEVRNYPINRGLLPELSAPRPSGFVVPGATTDDGGDSVNSRRGHRMDANRFRTRPGGMYYQQNGSLSSLNEYDSYEDMFETVSRSPPTGQFYPQQRRGETAGAQLEEVEEVPLNKEQVTNTLTRFGAILQMLSRIPFPRMSVTGMGLCSLVAIFFCPRAIGSNILFPGFRLLFGTLYPAYASYKAVRTKNVKEYVKWMMYWIVFAFFTFIETFTDILLSWFPFYYEIKVIVVLWLLSPATRGSSTLYRKFVHPMLTRREQEIDDYINQAKEKGYTAVLQLGSKGVNYATNVIMQTAIKVLGTSTDTTSFGSMMRISQSDNSLLMSAAAAAARASVAEPTATGGGGLVQTLRKSYSLSDLSEPDTQRTQDEVDEIVNRPQRVLRSKSSRSSSGSRQMEMYFPEVEVAGAPYHATAAPPYNYIRSSDDISSGYSSAEPGLSRTASMSNTARPRLKSKTRENDDEYEADVFYDEQDQMLYYGRGNPEIINRSQQRAAIYELHGGGSSSLPAITQAGHNVELGAPIYSNSSQQGVPTEMNDKYKLFLAWMEEQQKRESGSAQEDFKTVSSTETYPDEKTEKEHKLVTEIEQVASVKQEERDKSNEIETPEEMVSNSIPSQEEVATAVDDDFQDTISVSSNDNDEFLEVEAAEPDMPAADNTGKDSMEQESVEIKKDSSVPEEKRDENVSAVEEVQKEANVAAELKTESVVEMLGVIEEKEQLPAISQEEQSVEIPAVIEEKEQRPSDTIVVNHEPETSNLLAVSASSSNSNLTSSSSSLAVSEGSTGSVINLAAETVAPSVAPKKHASFGKQRKAPPVPPVPTPEMVVIRERPSKPSTVPSASKAIPAKTMTTAARTSSPAASEKSKPKKFMSSLTGMFKGHGEPTAATSPEKMSASCTTLPRTKKPEKVTKTRSKTEKPSV
uniref:Receptor expression-enhancing protein n=1 Tax=Anopheles epiroticus TaxID=199890 RepID=A0A182P2N3_9DIPT